MSVLSKKEREALDDVFASICVCEDVTARLKRVAKEFINSIKLFMNNKFPKN